MSGFFDHQTDKSTLEGCRRGDSRAQTRLFECYSSCVFTLAYRLTASRPLADEVVQDTFVEVLTKIDQFRGDAPIGAWIRRIAINKAFAQLRSPWLKRGESLKSSHAGEMAMAASAGSHIGAVEHSVALDLETSLARLNVVARTVLWLHDVEGFTHKEIASQMGKTISFSKSQLSRAHQKLNAWASNDMARQQPQPSDQDDTFSLGEESCMPL